MGTAILWLRRDLRLHDLPALGAAAEAAGGGRVLPVFVLDPVLLGAGASRRTRVLLDTLDATRPAYDGALVLRRGRPEDVLPALAREVGAGSVHVSAESTPYGRRRDERVRRSLPEGVALVASGSPYAVGPGSVLNGSGEPYKVFTPFSRAWRDHGWPGPAPVPAGLRWHRQAHSDDLPDAADAGVEVGAVGEEAARDRWATFLDEGLAGYATARDRPDLDATSRLSMDLKYGTIHPRTLLADLALRSGDGARTFTTEIAWREFYADVLWHNPGSAWDDLRPELRGMEYDDPEGSAADGFAAWAQGRTGYPVVDAGMRQLLAEGWMHNRLRMVTASFLVKDLHVWWPHGARHFLSHLRDGDIASNNQGWQWVAGTGTDAAPYFRVFNPVTQGKRFDPDGTYVRRWVPELRDLRGATVHEPWRHGGVDGYPDRVVDHAHEREVALARYRGARGER